MTAKRQSQKALALAEVPHGDNSTGVTLRTREHYELVMGAAGEIDPDLNTDRSARCLYCNKVTGVSDRPGRKTVCSEHQYSPIREEGREVAAGMRVWARPLSFWVYWFKQTPLPDYVAAEHQAFWDAEQDALRRTR